MKRSQERGVVPSMETGTGVPETDQFSHDVTTKKKPWTHLDFGDRGGGSDFSFAIIPDRTGRPRAGVFEKAIAAVNRMRPDFVMSTGDFINGMSVEAQSRNFFQAQWKKFLPMVKKCVPPFFFLPGNHDCCPPTNRFPGVHELQQQMWKELFGVMHYHFLYKNVLFLCLDSNQEPGGGIGEEQEKWAENVLKRHSGVRWTFVFLHQPDAWLKESFQKLEKALYDRNYTVISGDLHRYTKYLRNGRKYFILGTAGGGDVALGQGLRGIPFGEFDHVTWVSMCGEKPELTNLALDGIYDEDVMTAGKLTWITPHYFRADQKLSEAELRKLREKGIDAENPKIILE